MAIVDALATRVSAASAASGVEGEDVTLSKAEADVAAGHLGGRRGGRRAGMDGQSAVEVREVEGVDLSVRRGVDG